ncbi:unnamed protein product [Cuscuta campestris]|uniref:DUF674 domain-containing protein n=1 Tax=Cuscuta campestris TaxID=132261 RepID=A0A484KAV8_9ASTE|nr:unnamed protein product [Cuscuta campestris]
MSLKLFVDRKAGRVVYAEANKDFVDLLIYLLSLPVASLSKHLHNASACSLGILHKSVMSLSDAYIHPTKVRGSVFKENESLLSSFTPYLLPGDLFTGTNTGSRVSIVADMASGYVKEAVTYMVTDDLQVKPHSTLNAIDMMKLFGIKDFSSLEEVLDATFGRDEALKLLNAALTSTSLLINKKAQKVVFAEAEKPFVDFLFYIMSLPVGTVIKLVTQKAMVGSLGNLYGSIADLSDTFLQPGTDKDTLLNPKMPVLSTDDVPLLMPPAGAGRGPSSERKKVYVCSRAYNGNCRNYGRYTDDPDTTCPSCGDGYYMDAEGRYVAPPNTAEAASSTRAEGGGYVRGVATYTVMDDLKVVPHSSISTITALNENGVKDFGSLEVKLVQLGVDEGLKLLKAALQTDSVLTTVFLSK